MSENDKASEFSLALEPVGTSGLKHSGGYVYEEILPKLQGANGVRLYREMADNSSAVGTLRFVFRSLLGQVDWKLKPAPRGGEKAERVAEFVEECRSDMSHSWGSMLGEIATMFEFGWSWMETVYKFRMGNSKQSMFRSKHDDGKIGWRKISLRAQDTLYRWEFDQDGSIKGMWQYDSWNGRGQRFLPIERSLLFRTETTKNNPEGRSLLRNSVVDWHYLKRTQEVEAIGIERELAGIPKMEVPPAILHPDASTAHRAIRTELERMLAGIKSDERAFVLVPSEELPDGKKSGFKFSLVNAGGSRAINTNEVVNRYETRILRTLLAQFLTLGQQQNTGSYSVGVTQNNLFIVAYKGFLQSIAEVFNSHAIPRLLELNGIDRDLAPTLEFGNVDSPQLAEVSDYISKLVGAAAITPSPELEEHLLGLAKLPKPASLNSPNLADSKSAEQMLAAVDHNSDGLSMDRAQGNLSVGGGDATDLEPLNLNGAQLASVVQITTSVGLGQVPRESGIALLQVGLGFSLAQAEAILAGSAPPALVPGAPPAAPTPGQSADELVAASGFKDPSAPPPPAPPPQAPGKPPFGGRPSFGGGKPPFMKADKEDNGEE